MVFKARPLETLKNLYGFLPLGVMAFVLLYIPLKRSLCPFVLKHFAPRATTRDGSTPSFWRGKAAPLPAGAPGRATAHAPSHLKIDFAHYSVPHLALFSHLFT